MPVLDVPSYRSCGTPEIAFDLEERSNIDIPNYRRRRLCPPQGWRDRCSMPSEWWNISYRFPRDSGHTLLRQISGQTSGVSRSRGASNGGSPDLQFAQSLTRERTFRLPGE